MSWSRTPILALVISLLTWAGTHGCAKSTDQDSDGDASAARAGRGKDGGTSASADGDSSGSGSGGSGGEATASSGGGSGSSSSGGGGDSAASGGGTIAPAPAGCPDPAVNMVHETLSCAGLYADIGSKELAAGVRPFTPAYKLWSDGAEKQRWVYLPEGSKIDNSDPDAWVLPVDTRMFKEFKWKGKRVETRLYWKVSPTLWLKTSYHWNDDETEATRFAGGEVDVAGDTYYIPSAKECDQCHKGRTDRALGLERVLMALPGAEGLSLADLKADDLLTEPPGDESFELGDDGTGVGVAALGYLHVNCGVSCHNGNPASEGYSSDLRLRLPPEALDGRSPVDFEALTSTIGVPAQTPRWSDGTRIVAGSAADSLLYQLISMRDPANPKDQMPPIGSRVVDTEGIKAVEAWINALAAP